MAAIAIENISVSYAGARVIDGLSLSIADGSFFTLLGPSGCGKTTLLRTLAGFLPADAGVIRFGATDVTQIPPHRRDIGMVFQDYALFPDKTVYDNVAYGLRARKRDEQAIKARVGEYLERVGLTGFHTRRPAELSGGQRQRVALARALVIQPQVLLMDEPLSNLDAKLRVQVRESIADLQREAGITTVFVTHDQEEALALSDRIGLMRQGRIEQNGTPQDIYARPNSAYVADFIGAANTLPVTLAASAQPGLEIAAVLAGTEARATAVSAVAAGPAVLIVRPEDAALSRTISAGSRPVTILRRQYLGNRTRYLVSLGNEGAPSLSVEMTGAGHTDFAAGETVQLMLSRALVTSP
ncbi:MAG: ABC transporter ATP-binding protein [Beijerinckiaceae bacterium]